jgi:hypothetical protein
VHCGGGGVLDVVLAEIEAFKRWRVTAINLLRSHPVACCEADTFDDQDRRRIMCFLGFVKKGKKGKGYALGRGLRKLTGY